MPAPLVGCLIVLGPAGILVLVALDYMRRRLK